MTEETLLADVKRKFRITGTTLDTDIAECIDLAFPSLYPYVQFPLIVEGAVAVESQLSDVDGVVKSVYIKNSDGSYSRSDEWFQEGSTLFFKEKQTVGTEYRLVTYIQFVIINVSTLPIEYRRGLVAFACAEFATLLAGDKSAYNVYAQANGARAVDNMLDLAQYYEELAERVLQRLGGSEGMS